MGEPCCIAAAHGQTCTCQMRMTTGEGTSLDWKAAWYALDRENARLRDALRMCASGSYTAMEKSRIAQGALDYQDRQP